MKKFAVNAFLSALLLLSFNRQAIAQDEDSSQKQSALSISLNYQNDNVYQGRKDSFAIPYLSPSLTYRFKSGIFAIASLSYLSSESRIDALSFQVGYAFTHKKWDGTFTLEKSVYNNNSYSITSEMTGSAAASIGYDFNFIKPSLDLSADFGTITDYAASLALEHNISLSDEKLNITPTVFANAGTRNNYGAYYSKRKYAKKRKGKTGSSVISANISDVAAFKLLDYEFSIPAEYAFGRFTCSLTPVLAVPVNPEKVTVNVNSGGQTQSRTFTEKLAPSFYWSVGLTYKFR